MEETTNANGGAHHRVGCHATEAEREGFEPSIELAPDTRLAGECLQPLGHLSATLRLYAPGGRTPGGLGGPSRRRRPASTPTGARGQGGRPAGARGREG